MRGWVSTLALIAILSGCSSSNSLLLSPGAISLSNEIAPFPGDYMSLAQKHFGIQRKPDLQISRPRNMIGAGVLDPQRWYVCVRQPDGLSEVVLVIGGSKIAGEIRGPAPELCGDGGYGPLG